MVRNESVAERLIDRFEPQIAALIRVVRRCETFLGPEDDWVEDDRRILYEAADRLLRQIGRPAIREKGPADHTYTVQLSPDEVEAAISPPYQRNLLSTRKYRMNGGNRQWAVGSWVYDPTDTGWQHHVYLFEREDGGTDIYAHREASVRNPFGHVTEPQVSGDPDGILSEALQT